MPVCPVCRSEFRPGFTRCEECDVELVEKLPEVQELTHPPDPAIQVVFQTTEMVDALGIKALLESHGIDADIQDCHSGLMVFGLPTSVAPISVIVATTDAAEASKLVERTHKSRSARPASNQGKWLFAAIVLIGPVIILMLVCVLLLLGGLR